MADSNASSANPVGRRESIRCELDFVRQCLQGAARELADGCLSRAKELLDAATRSYDAAIEMLELPSEVDEGNLVTIARILAEDLQSLRVQMHKALA